MCNVLFCSLVKRLNMRKSIKLLFITLTTYRAERFETQHPLKHKQNKTLQFNRCSKNPIFSPLTPQKLGKLINKHEIQPTSESTAIQTLIPHRKAHNNKQSQFERGATQILLLTPLARADWAKHGTGIQVRESAGGTGTAGGTGDCASGPLGGCVWSSAVCRNAICYTH